MKNKMDKWRHEEEPSRRLQGRKNYLQVVLATPDVAGPECKCAIECNERTEGR